MTSKPGQKNNRKKMTIQFCSISILNFALMDRELQFYSLINPKFPKQTKTYSRNDSQILRIP